MEMGLADIALILLITVGPIKAAIVMGNIVQGADPALRRAIALRAVLVAAIVALVFVLFGEILLGIFHVSLPALKLAGGLILTIFALNMIFGGSDSHGTPAAPTMALAVFPLAVPLIATPQGLVAIVAITAAAPDFKFVMIIAAIVLAIMAFNAVFLVMADKIIKLLGPAVLQVVAKVFGVLLTGLAMQLFILGLQDLGLISLEVGH